MSIEIETSIDILDEDMDCLGAKWQFRSTLSQEKKPMRTKRYIWLCLMLLGIGLLLVSCGDDDDDDDLAPGSFQGKTYQMIVTSGTLPLARSGTANITFAADGTYTVTGVVTIGNDQGTYTYNKTTDDSGEFTLNSTLTGWLQVTYVFTFTQEKAGNFTGTLVSDPAVTQQGTFTEL